jgi:hypothetical protein
LEGLYFSLKAAHVKHEEQHDEIVTEAPSADDLMQYLAAYAAAIGGQPELSPTVTTTEATNV